MIGLICLVSHFFKGVSQVCDCELCSILIVFLFVFLWLVALLWPYVSTKTLLPNRVKQYAVVDEENSCNKSYYLHLSYYGVLKSRAIGHGILFYLCFTSFIVHKSFGLISCLYGLLMRYCLVFQSLICTPTDV